VDARGSAAAVTGSVVDEALCGGGRILWGARRTGCVSRADDPKWERLCLGGALPGERMTAKEVLVFAVAEATRVACVEAITAVIAKAAIGQAKAASFPSVRRSRCDRGWLERRG